MPNPMAGRTVALTTVTPKTELVAQFFSVSSLFADRAGLEQIVTDEQEAVRIGQGRKYDYFTICERTSVELGGETLTGKPRNVSGRCYLRGGLLTRDEVIAEYTRYLNHVNNTFKDDFFRSVTAEKLNRAIETYKKHDPAKTRFVSDRGNLLEYLTLTEKDKAFDRNGAQVWPTFGKA